MSGGEHSWKRVLFDTNMVSRWMDGDSDFQAPLKALVRKLAKRKATFFVSAVTIQELMVFARASGVHQKAHAFLSSTFSTLEFDERAALEAARIGAALPVARGAKQGARDLWHRDIAILGTASVHELDAVITANGADFLPFQDVVPCEIHVVAAVPLGGRRERGSRGKS
jgi:predicted nucleic acid-binding protein